MSETFDIVISGGGIAGLVAACLFGSEGKRVLCVDPSVPATTVEDDGADLRSTALLQPSIPVLERAGLWHALSPHATPLQTMRIIDAGGEGPELRNMREFDASDISDLPFGWNLPNWLLRREMLARIDVLPNVEFRPGVSTTRFFSRITSAKVWLSDGSKVDAKLVIAADGRHSTLRDAAGINVTTKRYGQKALAFAVTHEVPHDNISTEIHRTGGPFTTVPLPDHEGRPSSAIVWMETGPKAQSLFAMDGARFEDAMLERSCGILGQMKLATKRSIWPIISQIASQFSAQRLALVAEAAHVVPPIGAQGLNMSLADLGLLQELSSAHGLGEAAGLDAYDTARRREARLRVTGIDLLNRTSMSNLEAVKYLRGLGIGILHDTVPIRKTLMALGMGGKP